MYADLFSFASILPLFSGQSKILVSPLQRIGFDTRAMDLLLYLSINDILNKAV